jgi:lipoic acid synthetase
VISNDKNLVQITQRIPEWLKRPPGSTKEATQLKQTLRKSKLNTVCEEARCPNIGECFSSGTATFMILGDICTRGCRFCSVTTGKPLMPESEFELEAERVVEATKALNLSYVVVTSVARDDLADGGASGFYHTVTLLKKEIPGISVEVLIPDLRGDKNALQKVMESSPNVINHNLETVPRLYRQVRPGSSYLRSLELLLWVKENDPKILTKTGIMLGLGEESDEVETLLRDCSQHKIDIFTAGQYMQPTKSHLPVDRYIPPEEFNDYAIKAQKYKFKNVFMGPLVRSSYHAGEMTRSFATK